MTNKTTTEVLEERGSRYGSFDTHADITQDLKHVMRATPNWDDLPNSHKEALEMIQHKVGDSLNGDPLYDGNYVDIASYSQLIVDEIRRDKRVN